MSCKTLYVASMGYPTCKHCGKGLLDSWGSVCPECRARIHIKIREKRVKKDQARLI